MVDSFANKKGCVIALCVVVVLILGVTAALLSAYRVAEQRYGLSPAPEISHERFADNDTRVRLVIRPELLLPYLDQYLPEEGEAPRFGPSTSELFRRLLPREIALLARSDLPSDKIYLTLFANEKYGGPYIQTQINNANVLASVPGVQWTSNGLELRERGSLVAEGTLALPESFKEARLEYWSQHSQNPPDTIKGGYFAELMVGNTNGDILTLLAIVAALSEEDWRNIGFFFRAPSFIYPGSSLPSSYDSWDSAFKNIFNKIHSINIYFDMDDIGDLVLYITIRSISLSGEGVAFFLSYIAFSHLEIWLADIHNLLIDGTIHWDETEEVIVGTYTLSGIEPLLKDIISATATLLEDRGPMFDVLYSVNTALQK